MKKTPINQLSELGQSFWYDNIHRAMLNNGELESMIKNDDLRGITSNPSIFEKAITSGKDYDDALARLAHEQNGASNRDYFYHLAVDDIRKAADALLGVYEKTDALDGYVSLEVSPDLANDTKASIEEGRNLFARIGKPNVMIKIPATKAGIPVIQQLIADGINVNATLLFSVERYVEVAKAYIEGLKQRQAKGLHIHNVASVASFFVSRVDSALDTLVAESPAKDKLSDLNGQLAIINAKRAYNEYKTLFNSGFSALRKAGARPQRLLWASTGTKNAAYIDVLYINELIGHDTVNTIPPATMLAFKDHGKASATLEKGLAEADVQWKRLIDAKLNINQAMEKLEIDGVSLFAKSFDNLLKAIGDKIDGFKKQQSSAA